MALLVLDEHLASVRLVRALRERGLHVEDLERFRVTGRPDPDVVRRIEGDLPSTTPWVLVTMDLTITEDHPRFDWNRYAIAWISVPDHLRGAAVEQAKRETLHRHAHIIVEQRKGDHFTYFRTRHEKQPPSLARMIEPRI